jgi:hypothetical protein
MENLSVSSFPWLVVVLSSKAEKHTSKGAVRLSLGEKVSDLRAFNDLIDDFTKLDFKSFLEDL